MGEQEYAPTTAPQETKKFNIDDATLGDIKYTYQLVVNEVSKNRRKEVLVRFGLVLESFLDNMGLHANADGTEFLWKALEKIPDYRTLPDDTRQKLDELLTWLKNEFGFEVLS